LRRKLAVTVFDDLHQGMQEIEFLADPTAGELRVGCNEAMTAGLVTAAIGRLSLRYPKLIFHMELGNSDVLQTQALRERKCELVVARSIGPQPDMEAEVLFHEQSFIWVARAANGSGAARSGLRSLQTSLGFLRRLMFNPARLYSRHSARSDCRFHRRG
jgi:DNA-binding transcriptional LysR family regulator